MSEIEPLSAAERIGLVGDVHGDLGAFLRVAEFMADDGVAVLIGLGDVGFGWPGTNWERDRSKLTRRLAARDQTFYWIDGNHENFTLLGSFPIGEDGIGRISPNIVYLPRGYRTGLASGRTLAVLGGANSVDREFRDASNWWREESVTDDDVRRLGREPVDILVGHDAPLDLPSLDSYLMETGSQWSEQGVAYSEEGRAQFHRGFLHVKPKLYVGGHYHYYVDETAGYRDSDDGFACRVVILDMLKHPGTVCAAILDTDTLELEFRTGSGAVVRPEPQVTELSLDSGGRWMVHTQHSMHLLDLDNGITQRFPGPGRGRLALDDPMPLRTLETCRIGLPGYWTLASNDPEHEYYRRLTTVIRHLESLPDKGSIMDIIDDQDRP